MAEGAALILARMVSTTGSAPPPVATPPAPARMGPLRRIVREVGLGLITLGVIVLLFVLYQLYGTNIAEAHSQHSLARQFSAAVARSHAGTSSPTPAGGDNPTLGAQTVSPSAPSGGAIDHLVIPRIGLDKFVVEGTGEDDLRRGPGHYPGTPLPGQVGNAAIAGHRTTYGAPFFDLNELSPGDPIYITDLTGHTWTYKVSTPPQVVSPNDVAVLDATSFAQLTLTTCNPRFEATSRLVVFARLSGPATAAPTTTVPASSHPAPVLAGVDNLGHGESSAWTPAILYGLLVVILWLGTRLWINRTRRWRRLVAFAIGIGVCLVPLWFCFENAVLLLPQSI